MKSADALPERANELYWNSDDTVEQIAQELGMSRNSLYASVQPLPAGGTCPECGEALVFPNRSSRAAGRATCSACATEVRLEDAGDTEGTFDEDRTDTADAVGEEEPRGRLEQLKEDLAAVPPERAALIGGAAALGVAVGAAAAKIMRGK